MEDTAVARAVSERKFVVEVAAAEAAPKNPANLALPRFHRPEYLQVNGHHRSCFDHCPDQSLTPQIEIQDFQHLRARHTKLLYESLRRKINRNVTTNVRFPLSS